MAGSVSSLTRRSSAKGGSLQEPTWLRWLLIGTTLLFLGAFLFLPLVTIFVEAFKKGVGAYASGIVEPDAMAAIKLTLTAAGHRGAAEPGLRSSRPRGHRQVRVSRARAF
jgi:ABC-type Fe3+ transport system permease subunit